MTSEIFTASYTSRPFWAGDALDLTKAETLTNFSGLMEQVVFSYSTGGFDFRVCKDGMLMLRVQALEAEARTDRDTPRPIEQTVAWWGRYLDHVNVLHLLLDSAVLQILHESYFNLSEITNRDAIRVTLNEVGRPASMNIPTESLASAYLEGRRISSYPDENPSYGNRMFLRRPLARVVFDAVAGALAVTMSDARVTAWLVRTSREAWLHTRLVTIELH